VDKTHCERAFYNEPMTPTYREEPCTVALNRVKGMSFKWSLNPYTGCVHRCTFCFVRAFEKRADRPSDDRYGTSIRIKTNVAEVLERELGRRSWKRELVAMGTATDPYQPAEGRYRLSRACIERLAAARTPIHLLTRGPLIVRDVDVLSEAARRAPVSITVSIPTVDPEIWRRTEPGTAPPAKRLRALTTLVDAGLDVGVGMAPILPGLSDAPEQLEAVVRAAREAGATGAWANLLYLRPGTREHFLDQLARDWPELLPRYGSLYADRAYLGKETTEPVRKTVRDLVLRHDLRDRRATRLEPAPEPEQLLFPLAPGDAGARIAPPGAVTSPESLSAAGAVASAEASSAAGG
jgi:DNA repair photolyase